MWILALLIASSAGLAVVLAFRREPSYSAAGPLRSSTDTAPVIVETPAAAAPVADPARVAAVNAAQSLRLWRLAYASSPQSASTQRMDQLVRDNVVAILSVDVLDNNFFPRRPALLPQLMQALDDPRTASDKIARMISHDPVLAADVLRTANSPLHRVSAAPVETIQRAIAVCGVEALRGILAVALLRPVFRATARNFPRLPRVLWERTERSARAAELYAAEHLPQDRFEGQLLVLLNALGPLVVHAAILDVYARNPLFPPNGALCVSLTDEFAPQVSQRIAWDWQVSRRLVAALEKSPDEPLTAVLQIGELLGTLAFLESQTVLSRDARMEQLAAAGFPSALIEPLWAQLAAKA
jgi:HD-like signal output (HDOD) protein